MNKTGKLKKLLFDSGLKQHICEECGATETWNGKPLTLQLHHIDGNSGNNDPSNAQILCPNCHSQTDNFRGGYRKTNEPELLAALQTSKSIREALDKVGRHASKGMYTRCRLLVKKHDLSNIIEYGNLKQKVFVPYKIECPTCHNIFESNRKEKMFCSKLCKTKSLIKYSDDQCNDLISSIRNIGWSATSRSISICDNSLRKIIQKYCKRNNVTLDLHTLSKFTS